MRKVYREYTNGEITIEWRSELCNHSGICINDLPAVFNMLSIPWVDPNGASTENIIKTVEDCPTGALAWRYNTKPKDTPKEEEYVPEESSLPANANPDQEVQIALLPNGPIVLKGNISIKMEDGSIIKKKGIVSLCRCGLSKKMPWCDGAHFKKNN